MRRPYRTKQLKRGGRRYRDFTDRLIGVGDIVAYTRWARGQRETRAGPVEEIDFEHTNQNTGIKQVYLKVRPLVASSGVKPTGWAAWVPAEHCVRINCPFGYEEGGDDDGVASERHGNDDDLP